MFQKGDYIVYGSTGVCRVEDVCKRTDLPPAERDTLFYRLTPRHGACTIYIPVGSRMFMRPVLTREAALALIARIPDIQADPCDSADPKQMAAHYRDFFKTHDCADLLQLIKTVYQHDREQAGRGRRPGKTGAQYMQQAQTLLHAELGVALGIEEDEVPAFIRKTLNEQGKVS